jgi:hypothetical protein
VKIACENAKSLTPSYLDGELSEEQAAPLRRHLLECLSCREGAQNEQALKRWFVDVESSAPPGFAARLARRAFAGDPGILSERHEPAATNVTGAILSFVVLFTAAAAAVLLVLALAIREERLPESPGLFAEEPYPQVLESLEQLNRAEVERPTGRGRDHLTGRDQRKPSPLAESEE